MKNRFLTKAIAIILIVGILPIANLPIRTEATISPSDNPGVISIIESKQTGVAPLAVHFEADATSDEFHNCDFTWNFDDLSSGNWGTNNKSKNSAKGAVAAHVFENPGTYSVTVTVKDGLGGTRTGTTQIVVENPDSAYTGDKTTCVNPENDNDFSQAPAGSRHISTNNLSEITQYATEGSRILFKRGASWTINTNLDWQSHDGPVTIGAYGTGANPDKFGIFENAPQITINSENFIDLSNKKDWRIMDLNFIDTSKSHSAIGGVFLSQRNLMFRLKTTGFEVPIGWGHWIDPNSPQINEMSIVSCNVLESGEYAAYIGSERLILLGNNFEDADQAHVVRVWQAYKSVVSNNMFSGSSLQTDLGRQALKMHGPSENEVNSSNWDCLKKRTEYTIVSDNIFGSSGPWPVSLGPQNEQEDERLSNIIFERNCYCGDFGKRSSASFPLDTAFLFYGSRFTIRNNIIDGANFGQYFTGITIRSEGAAPNSQNMWIYNNTIYKPNNLNGQDWTGIRIAPGGESVVIKNNLVSFPAIGTGPQLLIDDGGIGTIQSNNLLNGNFSFVDPNNTQFPLLRSFELNEDSVDAIGKGSIINSVFEDFNGNRRSAVIGYDIGATAFNIALPEDVTYTVTYNLNGGTNHVSNTATYTYGTGLTLQNPTKTGYTFGGWYDNAGFTGSAITEISTTDIGDKTVYAKWTAVPTLPDPTPDPTPTPETKTVEVIETPKQINNPEKITIKPNGEAFDESVEVRLKDDPEVQQIIKESLDKEFKEELKDATIFPLDISLYIKGTDTKVQPNEGTSVTITCPIPESLLADKDKVKVVCVIDDKLTVLETKLVEIDGVWCAEFTANHFSPYAMVVDTSNVLNNIDETATTQNPKAGENSAIPILIIAILSVATISIISKKSKFKVVK